MCAWSSRSLRQLALSFRKYEIGPELGPGYNLKGPLISHPLLPARPHPLKVTQFLSNWEPNVQTRESIKDISYPA